MIAISRKSRQTRRLAKRAEDAISVGEELRHLTEHGMRVLHDRSIPGTSGNIEHFVIGNHGVTVVRAASSRGRIRTTRTEVFVGGSNLTLVVNGLEARIDTVRHMLGGEAQVHGALALPREPRASTKRLRTVAIGTAQGILDFLLEEHGRTPPGLDIARVTAELDDVFIPAVLLE